jgi:hypothetical protein
MLRKELYDKIKKLGAQNAVKERFGDNFTRVSSANLEGFIKVYTKKPSQPTAQTKATCPSHGPEVALVKLVSILQAKKLITAKEANEVASSLS